jgi:hypothetical protein
MNLPTTASSLQGDYFCGSLIETNPQKVPMAFVERLTDAMCYAAKWLKSSVERLSEKGRKSLRCCLVDHRNGTFGPIFASPHRLNPRFEGCSYPFSDSLSRLDFSHLGEKGVGYALVTVLGQKR